MSELFKAYDGTVNGFQLLCGVMVDGTKAHDVVGPETVDIGVMSSKHGPLEPDISSVVQRAIEVIGTRESALRWLGTPVRALNFATPISLLDQPAGFAQVDAVLTSLEHGVL